MAAYDIKGIILEAKEYDNSPPVGISYALDVLYLSDKGIWTFLFGIADTDRYVEIMKYLKPGAKFGVYDRVTDSSEPTYLSIDFPEKNAVFKGVQ